MQRDNRKKSEHPQNVMRFESFYTLLTGKKGEDTGNLGESKMIFRKGE